jgi:hypothetical protein
MMAVYLNVVKGFVPQACLPMHDAGAATGLSPQRYRYEMTISTVHTGVVPESVMCRVKVLMEFLKLHIRSGDQKTTLRGALKALLPKCMLCRYCRLGPVKYPNVQMKLSNKQKALLPKCMLRRLGPVKYPNVQMKLSNKQKNRASTTKVSRWSV